MEYVTVLLNELTFVFNMILREIDGMHSGGVSGSGQSVSQSCSVVVSKRGGAP